MDNNIRVLAYLDKKAFLRNEQDVWFLERRHKRAEERHSLGWSFLG